ncbi:rhodanese-like domain-containing protein [Hymenobacter tibetensis]|uniref:Rhodanese-like domain-containing protein n=1 Tax=Hymenobacter tibetensis TaxID=497967 RepID=A0ABY4D391_9BACT|nr:rhodanese-like domain-containing protein [Hymenobacter tibetensis]UOG77001.1 rhodanese-like domain-containing protein [Hymenobacter tibetensis]
MARFLLLVVLGLFGLHQSAFAQAAPPFTPGPKVAKLLKKRRTVLLDVRTPAEFAAGHLQGAENLDFRAPDFPAQVAKLDKSNTYVLYCASGNRSGKTNTLMQEAGFKHVVNAGSFKDLKGAGFKTEE